MHSLTARLERAMDDLQRGESGSFHGLQESKPFPSLSLNLRGRSQRPPSTGGRGTDFTNSDVHKRPSVSPERPSGLGPGSSSASATNTRAKSGTGNGPLDQPFRPTVQTDPTTVRALKHAQSALQKEKEEAQALRIQLAAEKEAHLHSKERERALQNEVDLLRQQVRAEQTRTLEEKEERHRVEESSRHLQGDLGGRLQETSLISNEAGLVMGKLLGDRLAMTQFIADLVAAIYDLFYDPTPIFDLRQGIGIAGMGRSPQSGVRSPLLALPGGPTSSNRSPVKQQGPLRGGDLHALCSSLEEEASSTASDIVLLQRRVAAEAEKHLHARSLVTQQQKGQGADISGTGEGGANVSADLVSALDTARLILNTPDWRHTARRGAFPMAAGGGQPMGVGPLMLETSAASTRPLSPSQGGMTLSGALSPFSRPDSHTIQTAALQPLTGPLQSPGCSLSRLGGGTAGSFGGSALDWEAERRTFFGLLRAMEVKVEQLQRTERACVRETQLERRAGTVRGAAGGGNAAASRGRRR
uniref:Uncharacterized protein n=1 Tax=Chromera velia CCMP2878 TaxID=1169474 RepID=A0A0G4GYG5_9ALVE|eukprot:Cvel_23872.t1-p1 / transcript=Cvel_23872.t1 / gene=Cvel_23872 / organism=Chromera_velia_CCMP2878 / gene_product=hypothetical protein / transcript_product=hypothetical protein / location=Cvel_scaffold2512:26161-27741(+) / protein_length=527 / sequence_SO=supercontig / SO=protein_coding / is_pseudo=false